MLPLSTEFQHGKESLLQLETAWEIGGRKSSANSAVVELESDRCLIMGKGQER